MFTELVLVTHGVERVTGSTVRHPIALIYNVVGFHDHRKLQTTPMDGYHNPTVSYSVCFQVVAYRIHREEFMTSGATGDLGMISCNTTHCKLLCHSICRDWAANPRNFFIATVVSSAMSWPSLG